MKQISSKTKVEKSATYTRIGIGVFFFVSGFNFAAWAARIPSMKKQLHLNDAELGTALAALPTGLMLTMPLAGILVNKISSRYVKKRKPLLIKDFLCYCVGLTTQSSN